jgi:hypothetical protein
MKRIITLLIMSLAICTSAFAQQADFEGEYLATVVGYYEVETEAVSDIAGDDLTATEVATIYGLSQRCEKPAAEVAKMYRANKSWSALSASCGLGAVDYFIMISGKIESKTFSPIFAKFSGIDPHNWKDLELTDQEIVDLVNLRIISSYHDYSLYDIMAMKDYGRDWAKINEKVAAAKKSLLEKQAKEG